MPGGIRWWSAAIALVVLRVSPAFAGDGVRFEGYRVDTWNDEHGLPQNTVTDVVQDRDGFLWATTFGGVVRFDGVEFDLFDLTNGLRSPRALSLGIGPDGDVWIGLEGRGLQRIRDGEVLPLPDHLRLAEGKVDAVVWSGGRLWIACDHTLRLASDAGWKTVGRMSVAVAPDGTGGVWFARGGRLWRATDTSSVAAFATPVSAPIISIAVRDGEPWFVAADGLYRVKDGRAIHVAESAIAEAQFGDGPAFDRDGHVWFAVQDLVFRVSSVDARGGPVVPERRGSWPIDVRRIFADRERNVWLGVTAGGLWRLSPEPFEVVHAEHSDRTGIAGIVPVDGGIVFGSSCSIMTHMTADGAQRPIRVAGCIEALWSDRTEGVVWTCADALEEHHLRTGERLVHEYPPGSGKCTSLLRDRRGRLWVGGRGRLFHFADGVFSPVEAPVEGQVSTIVEAPDRAIWLGQPDRIVVVDGDDHRVLDGDDGVPLGQVRSIHFHEDATFVGTYGGGLARITPDAVQRFDRSTGLLDNFISFVTTDGAGRLWLSSNRGVARILLEDFEAVASGRRRWLRAHAIRLGEAEGRPTPSGYFDGEKLWVAGVHGIGRVNVDEAVPNDVPPVAEIKSATLDGMRLHRVEETVVGPGRGELRIRFHAALLRAPGLRAFEHRLRGLDADWIRTERVPGRAIYDGLAPGAYRFDVRAINEDGIVGPPASLAFVLEPHFTERNSFRAALGLVFLALAYVFARWRTRGAERRAEVLAREIESRRSAEAALRDSEKHYRSVFATSVNGFLVVDAAGRIVEVNSSACGMFGYEAEELVGARIEAIVSGAGADDEIEVQLCTRKDGSSFEARVRSTSYTFEGGHRTVLTVVDLSPLVESQRKERRLREQLLHSQRVEAMGRLAGGIAHDVNNMLTAVKCYAELALSSLERDPNSARSDLVEITAGVERTTKLTKQLLAFGQRETAQPRAVDIASVVRDVMPMLSRLSRDDIEIVFEPADADTTVFADPTHLEQIVVNLVINASQAMPQGGKITLGADAPEPDVVRLTVQDDGVGMTEEIKIRIFEPFFTTKESQESSGLGLSVVHGIVTQAGGRIDVESAPAKGTRFEIRLPQKDASGDYVLEAAPVDPQVAGRGERLLYCDDDAFARRATARILRNAGYEVIVAGHADEAIELAAERPIALLVTDVVMPDMNGRELYEVLRGRDPDLRVLYVSGYARDYLSDIGDAERFLPKPYDVTELLGEIRVLLER